MPEVHHQGCGCRCREGLSKRIRKVTAELCGDFFRSSFSKAAGYNNGTGKTIPVYGVDATDDAKALIKAGEMAGTVKQDAEGMAQAVAQTVKALGEGKGMTDALAAAAASDASKLSIASAVAAKLYVAYAPYTGE